MMLKLYLATRGDEKLLVCMWEDSVEEVTGLGFELIEVGLANRRMVPYVIGKFAEVDPLVFANLREIRQPAAKREEFEV